MLLPSEFIEKVWHSSHPLGILLAPLGWLYAGFIILRRLLYQSGAIAINQIDAPVIVVGNISVGGTGKTPLVLWLVEHFREKGLKPGIISRGHGGTDSKKPQQVRADSNPMLVGDEPVLLARNTLSPVAVARRRTEAAEELIKHYNCNLIICDDGLQHYALGRDLEIAVIDGQRRFGNQRCLPAGPLREPLSRLHSVDLVVSKYRAMRHEYKMDYEYSDLVCLTDANRTLKLSEFANHSVHAVAGIGNPERFFSQLRSQNLQIIKHQFPDHHPFTAEDIMFNDGLPIVMTEKDAVKCFAFATDNHWFLPVKAELPDAFSIRLDNLMKDIVNGQKTA